MSDNLMGSESATVNKKNLDAASSKAKKKDQDKLRIKIVQEFSKQKITKSIPILIFCCFNKNI